MGGSSSKPSPAAARLEELQASGALQMVGGVSHNLCCAPCDSMYSGRQCYWLCDAPGCPCPAGAESRPPEGAEWERAQAGPLPALLAEARAIIAQSRGRCCCCLCPCPNNYIAQRNLMDSGWTARANAQLAPIGLRVRVDAWTETTSDGRGGTTRTDYLMLRFLRGAQGVLLESQALEAQVLGELAVGGGGAAPPPPLVPSGGYSGYGSAPPLPPPPPPDSWQPQPQMVVVKQGIMG